MRPSRKRMPTKLCVMVEARSDQPGAPAFENLSIAKAVQYIVSADRVFAASHFGFALEALKVSWSHSVL